MANNTKTPDPLRNLKDADPRTVRADHAAYKRNKRATDKNQAKDNAGDVFGNPNKIGHPEPARNDGDQGGAD